MLQVHSLERPKNFDAPFTLCDANAARRAVTWAAKIGVPFRVTLPTYGYLVAFAPGGQFVGLSAEETAAAVGSTTGAVRVAQHRALSRLKSQIVAAGDYA